MQIKSLEYFIAAAEADTFSEAAERIFTTQSTVSKQIIALEKELGVELFDRSRRRAVLTPIGEHFLQYARTACEAYEEMIQTIQNMTQTPNRLSVAFTPIAYYYCILDQLHRFRLNNPHIFLTVFEKDLSEILTGLDRSIFDAALLWGETLDTSKYQTMELYRDNLVVLVNADNPLASMGHVSFRQLKTEAFFMLDHKTGMMDPCIQACRNIGGFEPRILYQGNSIESIVDSVSKNMSICLMMNTPAQSIQRDGLKVVPLLEIVSRSLVLAHPRNRPVTPVLAQLWTFFEELKQRRQNVSLQFPSDAAE